MAYEDDYLSRQVGASSRGLGSPYQSSSFLDGITSPFKNTFGLSDSNMNIANDKFTNLANNAGNMTSDQYNAALSNLNTEAMNIGDQGGFDTLGDKFASTGAGLGLSGLGLASSLFNTFSNFSNARTAKKLAKEEIASSREARQQKRDEIARITAQTEKNNAAFGGN